MTSPLDPGYNIQELRGAMNYYNLPGSSEVEALADLRGDGIDGDDSEFGAEEFAAEMLGWENDLSADDLMGWDPFKAIKKTVGQASQLTTKVVSPVAKKLGKVPVVGKALSTGLTAAAQLANPLSVLQPRAVLNTQLAAAKAALPVAKQLAKSPVVKAVVGGAAIVFPPVGVPAAAALAAVSAVANAVDSKAPGVREAALKVVQNTTKLARQGDKGAQIALSAIATQKQAITAKKLASPVAGARRIVYDVYPGGRLSRIAV